MRLTLRALVTLLPLTALAACGGGTRIMVPPRLDLTISGDLVDAPARFSALRMKVVLDGPDEEDRQKLVTIARNGCAVSQTLARAAEVEITLE